MDLNHVLHTLLGRDDPATSDVAQALRPPPGRAVNYINPESRGDMAVNASLVTFSLAAVFVVLRIMTKMVVIRSLGWDDYTCVVAWSFSLARTVGVMLLVNRYKAGRHSWDVPVANYQGMIDWIKIEDALYLFGIMFAKITFILLYLRIFGVNKRFTWACYALAFIVIGYCLACALAILIGCSPASKNWDLMEEGTCISLITLLIVIGGFNVATDFSLLLLPIPLIWNLHMPWPKKLGIFATFATGAFVCAIAVVRTAIVVTTLKDMDQSWNIIPEVTWLTVELNVGIISACLPTLKPLFGKLGLVTSIRSLLLPRSTDPKQKSWFPSSHSSANCKEKKWYQLPMPVNERSMIRTGNLMPTQFNDEDLEMNSKLYGGDGKTDTPTYRAEAVAERRARV